MEKRRRGGVSSLMVLAALLTVAAMPSPPRVAAALSPDYYKDSCPDLESIVRYEVTRKKNETVVTIPATLRLVFHDCMVGSKKAEAVFGTTKVASCALLFQSDNMGCLPLASASQFVLHWLIASPACPVLLF
ncbi:unnamed protein product [Miscanthus lutarioriparius]|uniref:Plant heme peroxidase family profile domain-containing protein n=1 Tax=Miscanthus lutarioriparius TaxID=422564 RepID=A0A811R461_9POAL|nr:unnamed protein product [Miscanthus lutarioriparius]